MPKRNKGRCRHRPLSFCSGGRHYLPQAQPGPQLHAEPHWQLGVDALALQEHSGWQRHGSHLHWSVIEDSFSSGLNRRSIAVVRPRLERSGYISRLREDIIAGTR